MKPPLCSSSLFTRQSLACLRRSLLTLPLLLWLLAACDYPGSIQPTASQTASITPSLSPETSPWPTSLPLPSATQVLVAGQEAPQDEAWFSIPTPLADPLRFAFPTPGPAPVSAWRPPLYPVPWVPTPYDHFYFIRPIAANEVNWPLADYRYGGVFLPEVVHTGIDIPASLGTPVLAAAAGRVTWAGYGLYRGVEDPSDPYGLAVVIKHSFGYQGQRLYTVYGHLDRIDVLVGQQVKAGDTLGLVGQTGKVTGPHLHFEVRLGGNNFFVTRNPELWLAPPQGWGILAGRLTNSFGELLYSQTVIVRSKTSPQTWTVKSYGQGAAIGDEYYRENLVLGDLPAGDYEVWIPYEGSTYNLDIHIWPGLVSFFTFHGRDGVKAGLPPTPRPAFTPPAADTPTPTP